MTSTSLWSFHVQSLSVLAVYFPLTIYSSLVDKNVTLRDSDLRSVFIFHAVLTTPLGDFSNKQKNHFFV